MGELRKGGTPARMVDVLELEGMWMTGDELHAELELRFGPTSLQSVRRAIQRLIESGLVESRMVEYSTQSRFGDDGTVVRERLEVRVA